MQTTTQEVTRALPQLDEREGAKIGDEILLDVAKTEKVKSVTGSGSSAWVPQSGESRAWTRGGDVD